MNYLRSFSSHLTVILICHVGAVSTNYNQLRSIQSVHRNLLSFEEEARAAQQQESSLNAATAEAIFSDPLWKSPTSLGCLM